MTPIRLFALDVDGTLTTRADEVSVGVREALRQVVERGVEVLICTGRGPHTTTLVLDDVGLPLGAIMINGALVMDSSRQYVEHNMLAAAEAREAVAAMAAGGVEPIVYDDPLRSDRILVQSRERLRPLFVERNGDRIVEVSDVAAAVEGGVMAVLGLHDELVIRGLAGAMAVQFGERASIQPIYHPRYECWTLDSFAPGCSKWEALRRHAARRGLPAEAVMAVGDGLNDIPMITGAGWGVAMGNADPEVKAVADEVVADNDHDGLVEAIERRILASGARSG